MLRQETQVSGGVGHDLHRPDGAGHPASMQRGEDRVGLSYLYLPVQESESVRGHRVGELPEPGPLVQPMVLVDREARCRSGAGGEVLELDAGAALGEGFGLVGAEERHGPGPYCVVSVGELPGEVGSGGLAVRVGGVQVDADDASPAVQKSRHEGLPPVVLDRVDQDVLGRAVGPPQVLVMGEEPTGMARRARPDHRRTPAGTGGARGVAGRPRY
ncbi:hypothetical protein [Streptomyces fagopyri]|uniref:hypothetical protein n=1 Tax=Streptomyces fagopyri TaxID=2662397 RepID=UPI00371DD3E4